LGLPEDLPTDVKGPSMAMQESGIPMLDGGFETTMLKDQPIGTYNMLLWRDPPFFMGNATISTGPFSIAMLNYQMVYVQSSLSLSEKLLLPITPKAEAIALSQHRLPQTMLAYHDPSSDTPISCWLYRTSPYNPHEQSPYNRTKSDFSMVKLVKSHEKSPFLLVNPRKSQFFRRKSHEIITKSP